MGSWSGNSLALYTRATEDATDWHDEQLGLASQRMPLEADQTLCITSVGLEGQSSVLLLRAVLAAACEGKTLAHNLFRAVVLMGLVGGRDWLPPGGGGRVP
jgi:hypothetical protein